MCGILGVFGDLRGFDLAHMRNALEVLGRRGPDGWGVAIRGVNGSTMRALMKGRPVVDEAIARGFCNAGIGIAMFHTRLAILDLTDAAAQPAEREGRWILAYNGEVYNYIELRKSLQTPLAEGSGDTEVLAALIDKHGAKVEPLLNGMWGYAHVDVRNWVLTLSTDQFGIKPLYYSQDKQRGRVVFGSDPFVLSLFTNKEIRPSYVKAIRYVVDGSGLVGGETYFDNLSRVAGGTRVAFSGGGVAPEITRWWKPATKVPAAPRNIDDQANELTELLVDAVRIRLRSDVSVGSCLSSGLDSQIVVGICSRVLGVPVQTFTAAAPGTSHDEWPAAKAFAIEYGCIPGYVSASAEDLNSDFRDLTEAQGEPIQSFSVYAQYSVMRLARQAGVKVLLDGQGADELFLGYDWQIPQAALYLIKSGSLLDGVRLLRDSTRRGGLPVNVSLGHLALLQTMGLRRLRSRVRAFRYLSEEAREILLGEGDFRVDRVGSRESDLERVLPLLLRYEDRNSMRFGVETRLPYLDPRIVDFALSADLASLVNGGVRKALLRRSSQGIIGTARAWNLRKIGFNVNEEAYIKSMGSSGVFDSVAGMNSLRILRQDVPLCSIPLDLHCRAISVEAWIRAFA